MKFSCAQLTDGVRTFEKFPFVSLIHLIFKRWWWRWRWRFFSPTSDSFAHFHMETERQNENKLSNHTWMRLLQENALVTLKRSYGQHEILKWIFSFWIFERVQTVTKFQINEYKIWRLIALPTLERPANIGVDFGEPMFFSDKMKRKTKEKKPQLIDRGNQNNIKQRKTHWNETFLLFAVLNVKVHDEVKKQHLWIIKK